MTKTHLSTRINTVVLTLLGCAIYAFGLNAFILPHKLLSGGLTGIAIMLHYLFGLQVGVLNLVLNIPILYAAYRWLGGWDVIVTIIGTIAISYLVDMFSFISAYNLTTDPIVGSIVGGIFVGLGGGVIYRSGGTSGGIDPLAKIANKYWGIQMGSAVLAINIVILAISAFIFSIELATITLISIYISAYVTNKFVIGFHQQKAAFIITDKPSRISHYIMNLLHRGVTLLDGEGAYTGEEKKVIFTVVSLMQVTKLKSIVMRIDPKAFVFIVNANEVVGAGFTYKTPAAVKKALQHTVKKKDQNKNTEDSNEIES